MKQTIRKKLLHLKIAKLVRIPVEQREVKEITDILGRKSNIANRKKPLIERFAANLVYYPKTGCWLWLGKRNNRRYGSFSVKGKKRLAHRFIFEYVEGEIPKGKVINHLCESPACQNPKHLKAVSQSENVLYSLHFLPFRSRRSKKRDH